MAALQPVAQRTYDRHRPERGLVYRVVETYWPLFLKEQARVGKMPPSFVCDEFENFLQCGIPEFGFVRTYCHTCRYTGVVAFSCKERGFCPSCTARRMNDEAAHLVDHVLPHSVPIRQWVLSFPFKLRYLMAHDPKLTTRILSIFINVINSHLKRRAKRSGIKNGKPGSVTFIQRFGSALNLNPHFHTLFADGVFCKANQRYEFFRVPPPSQEELHELVGKIRTKTLTLIDKLGLSDQDQLRFDEDSLEGLAALSIDQKSAFGERAGQKLRHHGVSRIESDPETRDRHSANVDGFSLNAKVGIAGDRQKLEKLIRYVARGPIATDRLTECFPNRLVYKMKTPWRDGTTHVSFSPLDFIARLVALVPPPKMNMIRYHGVFAPNCKDRSQIVPAPNPKSPEREGGSADVICENTRRMRMRWSDMLKRTFKIDVTVCPQCKGHLEQIAVIKDPAVAVAILKSLKQTTIFQPLEVSQDRGPPDGEEAAVFPEDFDQRNSW